LRSNTEQAALVLGASAVGEHLLLDGVDAPPMRGMNLPLELIRVPRRRRIRGVTDTNEPVPTPRYRELVAAASRIAAELEHVYVGAEHLLLAIVLDRLAVSTQVLARLVDLDQVEAHLRALMASDEYKTSSPFNPPEPPESQ
jgi:ATP-dependent Clp protease ATP-binding subunit ClpA